MEIVSSHFGYTEEYVMDKTPYWLKRKFQQADREMYEERQAQATGIQRGITVVLDVLFNNGKEVHNILPSYDEAMKELQEKSKKEHKEKFDMTMWWKPGQE